MQRLSIIHRACKWSVLIRVPTFMGVVVEQRDTKCANKAAWFLARQPYLRNVNSSGQFEWANAFSEFNLPTHANADIGLETGTQNHS